MSDKYFRLMMENVVCGDNNNVSNTIPVSPVKENMPICLTIWCHSPGWPLGKGVPRAFSALNSSFLIAIILKAIPLSSWILNEIRNYVDEGDEARLGG